MANIAEVDPPDIETYDELDELNELLEDEGPVWGNPGQPDSTAERQEKRGLNARSFTQWTIGKHGVFIPAGTSRGFLPPGAYEIQYSQGIGTFFKEIPVKDEGLLRFAQGNSDRVVEEIQKFWTREDLFSDYSIAYRRGILLWGPAGCGKSCTIQLVMRDVIDREGVVISFTHPELFTDGFRIIREIQPETPVVVLMEDLDAIIHRFNESTVLNILDGVEKVHKAVFLATTNYPERLGARIVNRPSRFDRRFKIDYPNPDSRTSYLEHLIGSRPAGVDVFQWVKDTEGFSLAHLKELFVGVVILGDSYEETLRTLKMMKEKRITSDDDDARVVGFNS